MYNLSSFFGTEAVVRDGLFRQTQFPLSNSPQGICYAGREQFLHQACENPAISCIVAHQRFADLVPEEKGLIVTNNPERDFYELHNNLFLRFSMAPVMDFGVHPTAQIHPSAIISEKVYIGARARIGPGVIVSDYSYIGNGVCVESGAIIGAIGHYYKRFEGKLFKVEHAGGVWLEKGVQVLAGAVVSKSLHPDFTWVGSDTVISIKAHVGHGCTIGKRCILTGNVQVSGFTSVGDDVWIGPSATLGNLLRIGNRTRIEIGSVVIQDVPDDGHVSGNFAYSHRKNLRTYSKNAK